MPFSCIQADYHMRFAHRSSARRHELFYVRCFKPPAAHAHYQCQHRNSNQRNCSTRVYVL